MRMGIVIVIFIVIVTYSSLFWFQDVLTGGKVLL